MSVQTSKGHILIVDDTVANVEVLGTILKQADYDVSVALNGNHALKILKYFRPDLILLDIMMPEIDGFEVCRKLKMVDETSDIPVIFLTAKIGSEALTEGFKLGAVDYLTKPFVAVELLARVNTHIQAQRNLKRLELALEKAEAANLAKTTFIANMSHEIRTPMNAILGFSEIIKSQVKDPHLQYYLQGLMTSGKSLLSLINDILDLSKVEAGKLKLSYKPISLPELIIEMETIFSQKAVDKGLDLILDISPDLPAALVLDEFRIRQVLLNLISNAVKFTEDGFIKVKASCAAHGENSSRVDLFFSVEDSGIGIPDEQREVIFNAFEQVSDQEFELYGGTGLGLTISRRLLRMMNGDVIAESGDDGGAMFLVEIKDVEVADAEDLEHSKGLYFNFDSVQFKPAKVLVVDDINYNRDVIRGFYTGYSIKVLEAVNGKEAIEMTRRYKPDLIIMDMKMPVMNGYDASKFIKADPEFSHIPILAFSASALKREVKEILKITDSYLRKPISRADLIQETMKFISYEIVEVEVVETKSLGEISHDFFQKFPGLLEELRPVLPAFFDANEFMALNELETLSREMIAIAELHQCADLVQWLEDFVVLVEAFDMNAINQKVKVFKLSFTA